MPSEPNDFLSAYFHGLDQAQQQRQFDATKSLEQSRLNFEMQQHVQTMAQHAKEFSSEQDYKNAMLGIAQHREEREHTNQVRDDLEKFQEKGGYFMPKPQDKTETTSMSSGAPDLSMFGASARPTTQPVGPTQGMGQLATGQALANPPQMPAIPQQFQANVPAAMQMPDPNVARQAPAMEGQPANTLAMRTTPQEQQLQDIRAKYAAKHEDDIDTPKDLQDHFGGGLPPKMSPDNVIKLSEVRSKDFESRARMADSDSLKREMQSKALEEARWRTMFMAAMKEKGGMDEESISANHKSVMDNPDSFHELNPKAKQEEVKQLSKEGLPAPIKLNPTQMGTEEYARRAMTSIDTVNNMLADPAMLALIKKRSGPILGRVGDVEQDIGAASGLSPDEARKIQDFRSSVRYLTFQEGKALFGSRIPIQLMKELQSTSPKTTEAIPMLKGSMDAVKQNAENTLISAERTRFGGKLRPDFYERNNIKGRNGTQEVPVPGFPVDVAAKMPEGIAKTFSRKDGDHSYVKRGSQIFEVVNK